MTDQPTDHRTQAAQWRDVYPRWWSNTIKSGGGTGLRFHGRVIAQPPGVFRECWFMGPVTRRERLRRWFRRMMSR